jgi:multiple sugar transport system permease protein
MKQFFSRWTSKNVSFVLGRLVTYALLITISYVFLYPFIRMIGMSLMTPLDIIDPEVEFLPTAFYTGNFIVANRVMNYFPSLFNSVWFSTLLAISQTIVSALTGFAFARYEFRFKRVLFALILVSFIVPVPVILIPRIMMILNAQAFLDTNLIGTIYPQLTMSIFGQGVNSAILILIFYNFFRLIPYSLYEAAKIDGANALNQFWHITIRLSFSTIVVVFLFSFVWNWNETYITNLLLRNNIELVTGQLALFDSLFFDAPQSSPYGGGEALISEAYKMAGTLLAMLPLLIVYGLAQRQFVEGIERTGMTGE